MASNQTPFFSDQAMAFPQQAMAFPPPPLSGSQDLFMGIGEDGGLNFQENPQLYLNQQQVDPSGSNNQLVAPLVFPPPSPSDLLSLQYLSHGNMSSELDQQAAEMETYLQSQNQRLDIILQEETRRSGHILQNYANNLICMIQQKENELFVANQTSLQLQQCLANTDSELKTWQKTTMEKEAIVSNLSYKLKKVQERMGMMRAGAPDANSTCGGDTSKNKDVGVEHKCKVCHEENLCVVLLPCKHLCCCKSCVVNLMFCPICQTLNEGSTEVYLA